jgi:hypothetical protein
LARIIAGASTEVNKGADWRATDHTDNTDRVVRELLD